MKVIYSAQVHATHWLNAVFLMIVAMLCGCATTTTGGSTRCTLQTRPSVELQLSNMSSDQIVARWDLAFSRPLEDSDVDFLNTAPSYVFRNAQRLQTAAYHLVDATFEKANQGIRSAIALALYTAYIESNKPPALTKLIIHAMERERFQTGDVVVLLGSIARQENVAQVYAASRHYWQVVKTEDDELRIRPRTEDAYMNIKVDRWIVVPFTQQLNLRDGITILNGAKLELQRQEGRFIVMVGNFKDAQTSQAIMNQFRDGSGNEKIAAAMGLGKSLVTMFQPSEQKFFESRCREWSADVNYVTFFDSLPTDPPPSQNSNANSVAPPKPAPTPEECRAKCEYWGNMCAKSCQVGDCEQFRANCHAKASNCEDRCVPQQP